MEKKQIQIECYFGWKGLVHSDLGFPHVGHILQIGQFGLLQSGSPCQITLMRLRICLNISVGSIFMRFNENLTRLKIFQHYSISELSVFFSLCQYFTEVWDNCIHFCISNSTDTFRLVVLPNNRLFRSFYKFKISTLLIFWT